MHLWPFFPSFWLRAEDNWGSFLVLRWKPQVGNDRVVQIALDSLSLECYIWGEMFPFCSSHCVWGLFYYSSQTCSLFALIALEPCCHHTERCLWWTMSLLLLLVLESVVTACWNPSILEMYSPVWLTKFLFPVTNPQSGQLSLSEQVQEERSHLWKTVHCYLFPNIYSSPSPY